jgi:hypothetical protein
MASKHNILKVFFDINETQKTIQSFVPIFHQFTDVNFWLKEKNQNVLLHMEPCDFCDWCEQDWYTSEGICWVNICVPRICLRDVMNSSEECQHVVMKKLEQVVKDCAKKTERIQTNPPSGLNTYLYKTGSIVDFLRKLRNEMRFQENFGHFLVHHVVPFERTLDDLMDWLNYHEHVELVNDRKCITHVDDKVVFFDDKCPPKVQVMKNHAHGGRGKKASQKIRAELNETQKQKKERMHSRKHQQRKLSVLKRNRCIQAEF